MSSVLDLPLLCSGKVRDLYDLGDEILIVASDRISTFDCVHPTPIPDKGKILTALSNFWFEQTSEIVPNQLIRDGDVPNEVQGRAILAKKLDMIPLECVVRGYLAGSGWQDYSEHGMIAGQTLPPGLQLGEKLPHPIFTPSTKAQRGTHDQTVDMNRAAEIIGDKQLLKKLADTSIALYEFASAIAGDRGIIIADTKLEFGIDGSGQLCLGDELFTSDSSRYWDQSDYAPGYLPKSFDKQFVRDWAIASGWDKTEPAPPIPDEVVRETRARYIELYERATDKNFS